MVNACQWLAEKNQTWMFNMQNTEYSWLAGGHVQLCFQNLGGFEMGDPKVTIGFNTKWSGFEWFCDTLSLGTSIYDWLVLWNILYFSIFWEQYPIWLIFFRGVETTNQWIYIYMTGLYTTHRIDTRMPWLTLRRKHVVSKLWRWIHATGRCEATQSWHSAI